MKVTGITILKIFAPQAFEYENSKKKFHLHKMLLKKSSDIQIIIPLRAF
jgi:hypothetical protein